MHKPIQMLNANPNQSSTKFGGPGIMTSQLLSALYDLQHRMHTPICSLQWITFFTHSTNENDNIEKSHISLLFWSICAPDPK